jgi:hypothetical protein
MEEACLEGGIIDKFGMPSTLVKQEEKQRFIKKLLEQLLASCCVEVHSGVHVLQAKYGYG